MARFPQGSLSINNFAQTDDSAATGPKERRRRAVCEMLNERDCIKPSAQTARC